MRQHTLWLWSILVWVLPTLLTAQIYDVGFQSGVVPSSAMNLPTAENETVFAESEYRGNYYLVIQFQNIPDATKKQSLAADGIELYDYIPNYAYLSKVPVSYDFGALEARALIVYEGQYKLSAALASGNYPTYAFEDGQLKLLLQPWPGIEPDSLATDLEAEGYSPFTTSEGKLRINIPESGLFDLAGHPGIQHLSMIEPAPEKEGWIGRAAHRVNRFGPGPGLHYDGSGVSVSVADDGNADHIDKKGRIIDLTGGVNYGVHADMTTGLFIGAGNLHPDYKGFAPGASLRLYFISNYPHINSAVQNYLNYGTIITSTSFGEGCGGRYTSTAQSIDNQVHNRPELLHFFSAGNAGNGSCSSIYGAYNYGNITGGRKAAKNVFAVANLFYDDNRVSSSSRGPAEDGRTKPDISGFGQGSLTTGPDNSLMTGSGTSAAAPSVAGTAALLVEAYRDLYGQQDPTADIVKSIMLNTAEDLGRKGPDFDFGWGRVHAGRALESLQQGQFVRNTIYPGESDDINITIPANIEQVNIMLYWTDEEGSPVAAKALVNDLDLKVHSPSGNTELPWKLSTVAHPDSLTKPAYSGEDHINNMEQVSIVKPVAGTYTIEVSSYILPSLSQDYVVTYSFIKDDIDVVFPHDDAAVVPGEEAVIRWDAVGNGGSFIVEYAVGNGAWTTISANVPGSRRHLDWTVPSVASANVRVRVRRGNKSDTSDGTFTILGVPQVSAQTVSNNNTELSWPAVPGADIYQVFKLGGQYMEVQETTNSTSAALNAQPGQQDWYAVRAGISGQGYGKRSMAIAHTTYTCDENIQVVLQFDLFPGETSWTIQDQAGNLVASGGPYNSAPPQSTEIIDICLPLGCFDFTIFDSHNDGMCCDDGNGSYQLLDDNGNILISGGSFAAQQTQNFCLVDNGPDPLLVMLTDQQSTSCHGFADGSLAVSASGGSGDYSYLWSDGANTAVRSGLTAGTYTVTVSDGSEQTSLTATVMQPDPITVNLVSNPPDCSGGSNGSIYAVVTEGAESLYTYTWSNGSSGSSINGLTAGIYSVTVTNGNGCSSTQSTLLSPPSPITAEVSATPASCPESGNGSVSVYNISGGTGNYTVLWSNGATTNTVNNLSPGNYSVTISDGSSCEATASVLVSALSGPQLSFSSVSPTCSGGNTGSITAIPSGGQSPYTYSWSNGETTPVIEDLAEGNYSLTLTDANNCTAVESILIESAPTLVVTISTNVANCSPNGNASAQALSLGGLPPYTYSWNIGATTSSVFGLQAGDYSVTVTDSNGCTGVASTTIQPSSPIEISASSTPPSCTGSSDGQLLVDVTNGQPPYTYNWSNGQTGDSLSGIAAGTYTVTVTDATGCHREQSIVLNAPDPIQADIEVTDATCEGADDGTLTVLFSGGTGGYNIQWSNGANGNSLSDVAPGTYAVTATDGNGCTFSTAASVQEGNPLSISLIANNVSCYDGADGQVIADVSGGTESNTSFSWSTGDQGSSISGLPVGDYSLTVTDEGGCQAFANTTISQPQPLVVEVDVQDILSNVPGSASTTIYGGTPPYSFNWSNGETSSDISGLDAGNYSLTIVDANGCTANSSFTVEDPMITVCESRGSSTQYEWIEKVAFGSFVHTSGNDEGYADLRGDSSLWINLEPGIEQGFTLTPGFSSSSFSEYWRVWIDFNQDGIFTGSNELVFAPSPSRDPLQGTLSIPDSLADGAYAMRVSMRYGSPPLACQNFPYGEVEDYLLIVEAIPEYCPSYALSSGSEWIDAVSFNGRDFISGSDNGYGDYTDSLLTFNAGDTVQFEVNPGFSINPAPEHWQIFIDFNGDGSFSVEDERVHVRNNYPFAYSGSFIVPDNVPTGRRRLRVIMSFDEEAPPCGSFIWGETEDYSLDILPHGSTVEPEDNTIEQRSDPNDVQINAEREARSSLIQLYPNPFRENAFAEVFMEKEGSLTYRLYNSTGQLVQQQRVELSAGRQKFMIPTNGLPNGAYWLIIQADHELWRRKLIKQ